MTFYGVGPVKFESVSAVTATPSVEVGTIIDEGDEKYLYVYNDGGAQINPGNLATVSQVTGYSVTVSTVTGADFVVGVCKHATLTTATYGWLMVRGFGPAKAPAAQSLVTGDMIGIGVDGVCCLASNATNFVAGVIGKCVKGTASAGVGEAFFRIF
jgi:hypothetical protein